jgi:hypothetical protein
LPLLVAAVDVAETPLFVFEMNIDEERLISWATLILFKLGWPKREG